MKRTCLTVLCIILLTLACKFPAEPEKSDAGPQPIPVTLDVPQLPADEKSTYRIIITGKETDTIGPLDYSTSKSVVVEIPQGNEKRIFCAKYDSSGTLLDTGSVTVNVASGTGQVPVTLTTAIIMPRSEVPLVFSQPENRSVEVGDKVSFAVRSTGAQLAYEWQKGTAAIPGARGATFTIGAVTAADDSTQYRCIVTNPTGCDTSASALLLVHVNTIPFVGKDTVPPVITLLGGDTVSIEYGDPDDEVRYYVDQVQVTDNSGSPIKMVGVECTVDIYSTIADTFYTIKYLYMDSSGNYTTAIRYVTIYKIAIKDTKPPIITVGEPTIYIQVGTTFGDPGVSVYDINDGAIPSSKVMVSGMVNSTVVGEYFLLYKVADAAGNIGTAKRIVIVQSEHTSPDRINPVIKLLGADSVNVPQDMSMNHFYATYKDAGFNAYDNIDGDLTAKVKVGTLQYQSPKFWYITYDVADAAGNCAPTVKRFFVTPLGPIISSPYIDLNPGDSTIQLILPATGKAKWKEPGYTAWDAIDTGLTKKVVVDSADLVANLDKVGTYHVTYSVTNSNNLSVVKTRTVQVVDYIYEIYPPVITILGRNPDTVVVGTVAYKEPGVTALHARDGDITAKVTITGSVDTYTIGTYKLVYSATSSAGLVGRATRIVYVIPER